MTKCGFVAKDNRVVTGPQLEANSAHEIIDGCPLTRCIGDHRFKNNAKLGFDKQAVIAVPETRTVDEWKQWDFILVGSSGFWELGHHNSKNIIEKIKKQRLPDVLMKAVRKRGLKGKTKIAYENSSEILSDVLHEIVDEGLQKKSPENGVPPIDAKGNYYAGYNNISAIMIRFMHGPLAYRDPSLLRESKNIMKPPKSNENSVERKEAEESNASPDPKGDDEVN